MSARKLRPRLGDAIEPGASERDIAAAVGLSRHQMWEAKLLASIPADEFGALIAKHKHLTKTAFINVARRRAGCVVPARRRRCPHCGGAL